MAASTTQSRRHLLDPRHRVPPAAFSLGPPAERGRPWGRHWQPQRHRELRNDSVPAQVPGSNLTFRFLEDPKDQSRNFALHPDIPFAPVSVMPRATTPAHLLSQRRHLPHPHPASPSLPPERVSGRRTMPTLTPGRAPGVRRRCWLSRLPRGPSPALGLQIRTPGPRLTGRSREPGKFRKLLASRTRGPRPGCEACPCPLPGLPRPAAPRRTHVSEAVPVFVPVVLGHGAQPLVVV